MGVKVDFSQQKSLYMKKCAMTCFNSKLLSYNKEFFADIVVRAIEICGSYIQNNRIGIKSVLGGVIEDSMLIRGVAFKKTFSYAGFEQQPKKFSKPKVLLLNIELEHKAEKDNAEIRIDNPDNY